MLTHYDESCLQGQTLRIYICSAHNKQEVSTALTSKFAAQNILIHMYKKPLQVTPVFKYGLKIQVLLIIRIAHKSLVSIIRTSHCTCCCLVLQ